MSSPIRMHQIEVDEEVYNFLKKHAEPFKDTPNSVLRRFLPLNGGEAKARSNNINGSIPEFRPSVPFALAQILQVLYLVKNKGLNRVQATKLVAETRGITTQAVIDKYCRQLGKKAYEMDELLTDSDMKELRSLLIQRFPRNNYDINKIIS